MAKSKHHASELEQLRQELKNTKAEVKHLKRELARATKGLHRLADLEEIAVDEGLRDTPVVEVMPETCGTCNGVMTKVAGKMRLLHHFTCTERKKK